MQVQRPQVALPTMKQNECNNSIDPRGLGRSQRPSSHEDSLVSETSSSLDLSVSCFLSRFQAVILQPRALAGSNRA